MAQREGPNGKKVVIQAIAIGAAACVEQMLTEMLHRLLNWVEARRPSPKPTSIKPQN